MESRIETYLNAAITGDAENLPQPISRVDYLLCELINVISASGSVENIEEIVAEKVAEIVASAPEDFDTLKEISDWIYEHADSAAAMNSAIQALQSTTEALNQDKANQTSLDTLQNNVINSFGVIGSRVTNSEITLGYTKKNLLKISSSVTSQTKNGITFTVNDDKSITVNGTATANTTLWLGQIKTEGNYYLTGCPSGGTVSTYMITITISKLDGTTAYNSEIGNGSLVVVNPSLHASVGFMIEIKSGTTVDNLTYYPMLRHQSIQDTTYEPYVESVDERFNSLLARIEALESAATT